jgi:hypothetical protein
VKAPTGEEWRTPVDITSTSATERAGFRKCRRQWFLTVAHRLDRQEPNVHFFLGTIYHSGLEAYYRAQKIADLTPEDRDTLALDAYQAAYDEYMARIKEQLGSLFAYGEQMFRDAGELGMEMLQNYLEHERTDPLLDEVIAVEFRVNVDIVHPDTGDAVGTLSVQADVVGMKDGELVVCDHKTASRVMPSAHLDLDDQLTAEVFAWWQATGNFPEKAIYNVSMKRAPKPPALLKSGKLSKAKGMVTTAAMYRAEIALRGLDIADYVDFIAYLVQLEESGEDRLFRREAVFRTPGQMAAFERDLYWEFTDMQAVGADPSRAYPNPTSDNCSRCPVRAICTTIQDDGDVAAIIQAGYVIADPRR